MNVSRRDVETVVLAVLAFMSVLPLRIFFENTKFFAAEIISIVLLTILGVVVSQQSRHGRLILGFVPLVPVLFAVLTRRFATPVAFEMTALTVFGATAIALSCSAEIRRLQSLSIVIGGFLTLFCVSISEQRYAIVVPILWMLGCIFHLVANHWERLDLAMPESVQRTWALKPTTTLATILVLMCGGYAAKDQFAAPQELSVGFMPSSGGSSWSDPAARRGVGTGDKAIATKDHADSFGAVDSDVFLESTESSLFDMFNDMIGEPMKKKKWERAQGMANQEFIPMHDRAAKSEQGGNTFSTERLQPKGRRPPVDSVDASVVQWDGSTGIRLAMHRYDTFDGQDWTQTADLANEQLLRVDIEEAAWFFDPTLRNALLREPEATSVGLLKVIRLASQRLPMPMLTAGIHIKDIDRQDFFGISPDGSFFMPGREKIPPLSVVHAASVNLSEDEIRESLRVNKTRHKEPRSPADSVTRQLPEQASATIESIIRAATDRHSHPYDQLTACVEFLRQHGTFDRSSGERSVTPGDGESVSALAQFIASRRGGDHLFATTAALMARGLGLSSRLVTGFYVRPDSFDVADGHARVLPSDVHVWTEVRLRDGRWFEIEPTPGYKPPDYRPSWRLRARRFAAASWPAVLGSSSVAIALYLLRCFWIDHLLVLVWKLAGWIQPHRRVRLAMRIIEWRARLVGCRRPGGKTQRAWLQELTQGEPTVARAAERFSDMADALFFGHAPSAAKEDATRLVDLLRVRTIHQLTEKATT
ncbi:MAG: transglutaminase-like domain-containing protein [Planctomycetota bacterium]